jgi:hypothetical protein
VIDWCGMEVTVQYRERSGAVRLINPVCSHSHTLFILF